MEKVFLDNESKVILKMVKLIHKVPNNELSHVELEKKLGINRKTVVKYVGNLLSFDEQKVFSFEDSILKMANSTNFQPASLLNKMMLNSLKFQIMKIIFEGNSIDCTNLCFDLGISRGAFSVHIKQLDEFLEEYNLEVKFQGKEFLRGEEYEIRFFFHALFWGLQEEDIITENPMLNKVTKLLLEIDPKLDYFTLLKIRLNVYISQIRTKNGHFITSEKEFIVPDHPYVSYKYFSDKMNEIDFFNNCPTIESKQAECRYLYFLGCCSNLLTAEKVKKINWKPDNENSSSIQAFIDIANRTLPFKLRTIEVKFLQINLYYLHRAASVFKGRQRTLGIQSIEKKIKENRPNDYALIAQFINKLCLENKDIKKLIQHFPTLYYHYGTILLGIFKAHKRPIKLLIQANFSSLQLEQLAWQIERSAVVPVKIMYGEIMSTSRPDGIISDWTPSKKYKNVPFFNVSSLYRDWNYSDLENFFYQLADSQFKHASTK
ncbi:MAG: helix-turn-helix domain-containing protein [Lactobacillales bacterium]|jgi:hypothetical protein|nr:helix-turn-helix domain-containing protein [Lactobacillales bacterium]